MRDEAALVPSRRAATHLTARGVDDEPIFRVRPRPATTLLARAAEGDRASRLAGRRLVPDGRRTTTSSCIAADGAGVSRGRCRPSTRSTRASSTAGTDAAAISSAPASPTRLIESDAARSSARSPTSSRTRSAQGSSGLDDWAVVGRRAARAARAQNSARFRRRVVTFSSARAASLDGDGQGSSQLRLHRVRLLRRALVRQVPGLQRVRLARRGGAGRRQAAPTKPLLRLVDVNAEEAQPHPHRRSRARPRARRRARPRQPRPRRRRARRRQVDAAPDRARRDLRRAAAARSSSPARSRPPR